MRQSLNQRVQKRTALVLIAILALGVLPLPGSEAAAAPVMGATLPSPRDGTSAVGTDDGLYVFGGRGNSPSLQIVHYDPLTDTATLQNAALPSGRSGTAAVWDGQFAYVIGGGTTSYVDQIVRFDPATDSTQVMSGALPAGRGFASAIWDGQHVYIFGGATSASTTTDEIVRYDPSTDTTTVMGATLPTGRYGTSAVWDGQYAYIFGGLDIATNTRLDSIVRYDPATDTTSVLPVGLPSARYHTSAVFQDGIAHIYGGYGCSGSYCAEIVALDIAAGTVAVNTTTLPSARLAAAAATFGRNAYVFGGSDGGLLDEIVRHGPIGPNHAPVLAAIADQTVQATDALNLTLSASDEDHDLLSLTTGPLPSGAIFTDHGDGTASLDWTPDHGQEGVHAVTVTVDDGTDTASATFEVNVTQGPDRAPVIDAITDANATAGKLLEIPVQAIDADGDPITLVLDGPANASLADNGDGTGTFSWTPVAEQEGSNDVTITAHANGLNASTAFTVNVSVDPNQPPVIDAVSNHTTVVGSPLVLDFGASDADGDALSFSLTPEPVNASFVDHGNGTATLTWNATSGDVGLHSLMAAVDDGQNSVNATFTIEVFSGNEPILGDLPDRVAEEGATLTFDITASDPNDLPLTLGLEPQPLPLGATFVDHGDGTATFAWDVPYSAAGTHFFTVSASNGDLTTSASFEITVENVAAPPQFTSTVDPVSVETGDGLTLHYSAEDPDGTAVSFSATGVPAGADFVDNGAGSATLSWASAGPSGSHTVTVIATSAGQSTSVAQPIAVFDPFALQVSPVTPSVVDAAPGATVLLEFMVENTGARDDTYSFFTEDLSSGGYGTTVPGNVSIPAGGSATVSFTVALSADPTSARPRVSTFSNGGDDVAQQLNWLVRVPVLIALELDDASPTVAEGSGLGGFAGSVVLTWADGTPADNLSFTAEHTWLGASAASETFQVSSDEDGRWRFDSTTSPRLGALGDHTLEVDVQRGGRTDTATISWTVSAV